MKTNSTQETLEDMEVMLVSTKLSPPMNFLSSYVSSKL